MGYAVLRLSIWAPGAELVGRRLAWLILAATLTLGGCGGQLSAPVSLRWIADDALPLGFDPALLNELIDAYAQDVADGELPGVNLLIARHGRPVLRASVGFRDREQGAALAFDDLFRLYSMTKPIAAALSLRQVEQGLYRLDSPVADFLPELGAVRVYQLNAAPVPAAKVMTLRHLLTHTAGFTAEWNQDAVAALYRQHGVVEHQPNAYPNGPASLAEFFARLHPLPLLHEPGARRTYGVSNDVQGVLAERAAETDLAALLEALLLAPLGMKDTGFCVAPEQAGRLAALYEARADGGLRRLEGGADSAFLCPVAVHSLSSGLVGTIEDYWRFAEALRGGGAFEGRRILQPASVALLMRPQPEVDEGKDWIPGAEWGLSLAVVVAPALSERTEVAGNVYWGGAANTSFWVDPANDLVALIFTQVRRGDGEPSIQTDFRNRVYSAFSFPEGGNQGS